MPRRTIAVSANFTAEPIQESLDFWMGQLGLGADVVFAPFDQVFQQLLDPTSTFGRNAQGVNVILLKLDEWISHAPAGADSLAASATELADALTAFAARSSSQQLLVLCPPSPESLADSVLAARLTGSEASLRDALHDVGGVRVVTSAELLAAYPVAEYHDVAGEALGGVPYTEEMFAALGTLVARHVRTAVAAPYKVIVLDCDNTLWGGVVGEAGVAGIAIGETHRALQEFAVRQQEAGMLICLASKNNEADVDEVFATRSDMLLTKEHIVTSRVNWLPKSENLKSLAGELSLGLDSFVFIDDSPFEIAEVRAQAPEVLALQLPSHPADVTAFLANNWAFDRLNITAEDRKRAKSYKENIQRGQAAKQSSSLDDFLRELELEVTITAPMSAELPRASQMTQRTNQFNFTTIRRTEGELTQALGSGALECRIVRVRDRFGDYGIVGLMLFTRSATAIVVDTMLLSCRALGRRVEQRMLASLGELARENGLAEIELPFRKSARNTPAFEFLNGLGTPLDIVPDAHVFRISPEDAIALPTRVVEFTGALPSSDEGSAAAMKAESVPAPSAALQRAARELVAPPAILAAITSARRASGVDEVSTTYVAPANEREEMLAEIVAHVLRRERVGTADNYFELGGDSIAMVQVISRLRKRGWLITPEDLFRHQTVSALCSVMRPVDSAVQVEADAQPSTFALSALQQGILFHSISSEDRGSYVVQMRVPIRGEMRVEAFRRAWDATVARHGVLRTTVRWEGVPSPVQVVADEAPLDLHVEDWRGVAERERGERMDALLADDRSRGFVLDRAPLSRLYLIQLADERWEMVWSYHHVILDGWSSQVILREVHSAYHEQAADAPGAARPYSAYVAHLAAGRPDSETFWKGRLAGFDTPSTLGVAARASGTAESEHGDAAITLSAALTARLVAFARQQRVTVNTLLQAAWAAVLSKASGSSDVLFGSTVTTRPPELEGSERMVGLFLNTVPVRVRMAPSDAVAPWLARLQQEQSQLHAHATTPLASILKWSSVARGTPLFESVLVFENFPVEEMHAPVKGGVAFGTPTVLEVTHYPLLLTVFPGERLEVRSMFDASRYDAPGVTGVLRALEAELDALTEDATRTLGSLGIAVPRTQRLTDADRELVVEKWNATDRPYPRDVTLHALIREQVLKTPDAVALQFGGETMTYGELHARALTLSRALTAHGAGPGVLVGVCMERSLELVVALAGILEAGAAYVPMDPEYPAERLSFMLSDAQCPVLLTQARVADATLTSLDAAEDGTSPVVLCLDRDWNEIVSAAAAAPAAKHATANDLAYMIYTSGSTGRPKGAMNRHSGIVNRLMWMQEAYQLTPADVVLQKTPMSFDVSVWEFFWPLVTGARLVLAEPGGHRDPSYVARVIRERGVSVLHFVPSMLRAFLDSESAPMPSVRDVMCSGEALPYDLVQRFFARFPTANLHNLYGPTEAAVDVTSWTCKRDDARKIIPIGRPIANTRVYVLDETMQPVPPGVAGELYLGGIQVGAGYHRRPELTAERFVNDPFARTEDRGWARLYRTGDSARWLDDGVVEYLGRLDFQVKLRGFRIELGEIEAVITAIEGVRDAVVVLRTDAGMEPRLVAYYIVAAGASVSTQAIRAHLAAELPAHMVPSAFMAIDAMPLSPSGKLDRKALPMPPREAAMSRTYIAPRTPAEQTLADIWAKVLRLERVSVDDNFFELGGDSILSIQIAARAREAGLPVTLTAINRNASVAELAIAVTSGSSASKPVRQPRSAEAPLAPIQRWFFEMPLTQRNHWNQAFLFAVGAELDVGALRTAVSAVIDVHDALRLRFARTNTGFVERVSAPGADVPLWVETIDARSFEPDLDALVERAAESLDIEAGPILRVVYATSSDATERRLLIAIHHLAVDGVSWRILREDLEAAYTEAAAGRTPRLLPESTPYDVWASELVEQAERGVFNDEQEFWTETMRGPLLALPSSQGANTVGSARTITVTLSEEETTALLQGVPAAYATQVNDVLALALGEAIEPLTGRGALLVDLEGHGREDIGGDIDLTRTVGWFTSIFPIRLEVGERGGIGERIKRVKERLRAIPRRGMGYGALRYLTPDGGELPDARASVLLNYLGQFDQIVADSRLLRFASESAGPWFAPDDVRPYQLDIVALVQDGRMEFRFTHADGRGAEMQRAANAMLASLRAVIAHCTAPGAGGRTPSDFPLVALSQVQVDAIAGTGQEVEDILPLAPMQALFLATSGADGDVGFEQWRYDITGALDIEAFRAAWQDTVERHQMLRASFATTGVGTPVQVIARHVDLPIEVLDWSDAAGEIQRRRMADFLIADRARGFRSDTAPLLRVTLIRTGDAAFTMIWSNHHLLLDRWSWPIVLEDVGEAYRARVAGHAPALPRATPWRRYMTWLHERDAAAAETYWRNALTDIQAVSLEQLEGAGSDSGERRRVMSVADTERLRAIAREHRVSVNAVIQAGWAVWLAGATERSDVVYGVAVSGRPEEVAGIDRLVGMSINNIPARVHVSATEPLSALLQRIADQRDASAEFVHAPLTSLQEWSGLPWHHRLFDTLVVFQNDDADNQASAWLGDRLAVTMHESETHTNFPLALVVGGSDAFALRLAYQRRIAGAAGADRVLEELEKILLAFGSLGEAPLDAALALVSSKGSAAAEGTSSEPLAAPSNDTEWVVARIFAELLGRDEVGVDQNFFDLGGQSLVATQVMSRVRDTFRLELPISLLFEHPTVERFAAALIAREGGRGKVARISTLTRQVEEMSIQELREAGVHA